MKISFYFWEFQAKIILKLLDKLNQFWFFHIISEARVVNLVDNERKTRLYMSVQTLMQLFDLSSFALWAWLQIHFFKL
jgi:hypothetical protein